MKRRWTGLQTMRFVGEEALRRFHRRRRLVF